MNGYMVLLLVAVLITLDFSDVDGDGEDELLVRRDHDGVVVVLGAGDGPLPRLQAPALTRETPPADMDPDLVGAWERAEDIVEFGVTDVAVDRFEALARLGVGTPIEGLALMRGAAVLAASGETVRALSLYSRAAELPESAASALEAVSCVETINTGIDAWRCPILPPSCGCARSRCARGSPRPLRPWTSARASNRTGASMIRWASSSAPTACGSAPTETAVSCTGRSPGAAATRA